MGSGGRGRPARLGAGMRDSLAIWKSGTVIRPAHPPNQAASLPGSQLGAPVRRASDVMSNLPDGRATQYPDTGSSCRSL